MLFKNPIKKKSMVLYPQLPNESIMCTVRQKKSTRFQGFRSTQASSFQTCKKSFCGFVDFMKFNM